MTILRQTPAPVNSDPSTWPAWTDADRWELGPDGDPVAPYTTEDAEWWDEQSRDDDADAWELHPTIDDADIEAERAYHESEAERMAHDEWIERLAAEHEAEAQLTEGYAHF